mmetsp:Transcript_4054/g.9900  ORF Transcript_4054/g.9900 Transcript_4054/m.9900 type:complete len:336 (-) Transcript_4054:111-1118(-)
MRFSMLSFSSSSSSFSATVAVFSATIASFSACISATASERVSPRCSASASCARTAADAASAAAFSAASSSKRSTASWRRSASRMAVSSNFTARRRSSSQFRFSSCTSTRNDAVSFCCSRHISWNSASCPLSSIKALSSALFAPTSRFSPVRSSSRPLSRSTTFFLSASSSAVFSASAASRPARSAPSCVTLISRLLVRSRNAETSPRSSRNLRSAASDASLCSPAAFSSWYCAAATPLSSFALASLRSPSCSAKSAFATRSSSHRLSSTSLSSLRASLTFAMVRFTPSSSCCLRRSSSSSKAALSSHFVRCARSASNASLRVCASASSPRCLPSR